MRLYGVDNPSKSCKIKEKKKKTFMCNYGVDNIFKTSFFKNSVHDIMLKKYGKKSLPNRYGGIKSWWDSKDIEYRKKHMKPARKGYLKWWNNLSDSQKEEFIQKKSKPLVNYFKSKIEDRVSSALSSNGIQHHRQFWIKKRSYDIHIFKTKIILEINGDFWHANPLLYQKDDLLNFPNGYVKASEIWLKDKEKLDIATKAGFVIIYLWEYEINNIINNDDLMIFIVDKIYDACKNKKDI